MAATKTANVARLTITINGTAYTLRRIDRDGESLGGWRVRKADGMAYRVVKDRWGVVRCSCPDDRSGRHKNPGECKHAKSLRAYGLIVPSFRAPNKPAEWTESVV